MVKRLAEKYGGTACGENYHEPLLPGLDSGEFPCLTCTRDLQDWHDFIRRTPDEYEGFLHSGFRVILRDDNRTVEETLALVEQGFGLQK